MKKNNTTFSTNFFDLEIDSEGGSYKEELIPLKKRLNFSSQSISENNSINLSFESKEKKNFVIKSNYSFNFMNFLKKKKESSNPVQKKDCKRCNCKNNNCLRLYCVCFKALGYCSDDCGCKNCFNNHSNKEARDFVIEKTKMISKKAFENKLIFIKNKERINQYGCKCKTSCMKHYCECRRLNSKCSSICKCEECLNSKIQLSKNEVREIYKPFYRKKQKINFVFADDNKEKILENISFVKN